MLGKFLDSYALFFGKKKFSAFNKFLFLAGARGLGILNYKTPYASGEEPFLKRFLADYDTPDSVVLDVGANTGQFAAWVLRNTSHLNVVSFEPNHASVKELSKNIGTNHRHTLVAKGASSSPGNSTIYDYSSDQGSEHASLYIDVITDIHHSSSVSEIPIQLTTVDLEVDQLKSKKICLLKIDTEGHEKDVLLGSKFLLHATPPPAIMIEFNEMNAVSETHYRKIKSLVGANYIPFRLLPGGSLLPLDGEGPLFTEIYAYQNLVFIRSNLSLP